MTTPLVASALPLPLLRRGKVREVYEIDADTLLLVASDRVSAFDVVLREPVPHKGAVLTQLSASSRVSASISYTSRTLPRRRSGRGRALATRGVVIRSPRPSRPRAPPPRCGAARPAARAPETRPPGAAPGPRTPPDRAHRRRARRAAP